jgi:hypothetical protein
MEQFEQEQSVNNVEVAEPQEIETPQVESENNSEVAEPKTVQDAETNAQFAEQRRKQELDQYRTKAESYQQQLDRAARLAGYQSHDELIQALDQLEKEQEREEYRQKGVDPDVLDEVLSKRLEEHPDVQFAREFRTKQEEEQRFNSEVDALFKTFPDLKPEQIPQEVLLMRQNEGLPLVHAYRSYMFDNVKAQSEQAAIQKLQQNANASPGSLGAGAEHKVGYSNMSDSDKKALRERVLRGETVQL